MYIHRYHINRHEIGLYLVKGELDRVLTAGDHRLRKGRDRQVEVFNRLDVRFQHPFHDVLVREPALAEHLEVLELTDTQRGFVWVNGRLGYILDRGLHAFWKAPSTLEIEVRELTTDEITHPRLQVLLGHASAVRHFTTARIAAHERGLVYRDGVLAEILGPGLHVYWREAAQTVVKLIDVREQGIDVTGQEIMTADKVTLRMNLLVNFRITDVEKSALEVSEPDQALYRESQLALRAAVGTRQLDEILADKESVGDEVRKAIATRAHGFGITVTGVGVRDIILPGEMKNLLNQVTEARKEAEANLIRRREETAAARSQANTARLLADNPTLVRMKEMESMQQILGNARVTFHFGQGDLRTQMRGLVLGED